MLAQGVSFELKEEDPGFVRGVQTRGRGLS